MKVRGTAQTVADKYVQLARDAVSTGDIVMSESYFQHAEHYNRIIAANQSQNQQQQQQQQHQQQQRAQEAAADDDSSSQPEAVPGSGPQPVEVQPADKPSRRSEKTGSRGNGEDAGDVASFDGDLPQFLQKPAEDAEPAEKPKRGRRPSSRSKTAKASEDEASDTPAETASKDSNDDTASDAEVVAS